MPDAKGTYYGPGAQGLATILPQGPNLAAIGANAATRQQRQGLLRQKRLDKLNDQTYRMIDKPWTTAQLYQPELDKKVAKAQADISDLILNGQDTAAYNMAKGKAQEFAAYASNAKQATDAINNLKATKTGKYNSIREDELTKHIAANLRNNEGELIDPGDLNLERFNAEEMIFNNPNGHNLLNGDEVMRMVLDSENLKNTTIESSTLGRPENIGGGLQSIEKTTKEYNVAPWGEIDPVTGAVKISDADKLIDSGLMNTFLDNRYMARVLEGDVEKYLSDNEMSKDNISSQGLNSLRATALKARLEGRDVGGVVEERREQVLRNIPKKGSDSSTNQAKKDAKFKKFAPVWQADVASGDIGRMNEAADYINKKVGLSKAARTGIGEFVGMDPEEYKFVEIDVITSRPGLMGEVPLRKNVYVARFKDTFTGEIVTKDIDVEELAGETGLNILAETFDRVDRGYKEEGNTSEEGALNRN